MWPLGRVARHMQYQGTAVLQYLAAHLACVEHLMRLLVRFHRGGRGEILAAHPAEDGLLVTRVVLEMFAKLASRRPSFIAHAAEKRTLGFLGALARFQGV